MARSVGIFGDLLGQLAVTVGARARWRRGADRGHSARVLIEGATPGQTLREAWLLLTKREALALREAFDAFLNDVEPEEDWHAHVTSDDGTVELTIAPHRDA
jgi:hypothetical protein